MGFFRLGGLVWESAEPCYHAWDWKAPFRNGFQIDIDIVAFSKPFSAVATWALPDDRIFIWKSAVCSPESPSLFLPKYSVRLKIKFSALFLFLFIFIAENGSKVGGDWTHFLHKGWKGDGSELSFPRDIPTSLCHSGEWTLELLLRDCRWHQHNSHQDSGCVGTIPVLGLATALSFLEQ